MDLESLSFYQKLREGLFRIKLYLTGIRFYEKPLSDSCIETYTALYQISSLVRAEFKFYKEKSTEHVLQKDRWSSDTYPSYYVVATFTDQDAVQLKRLHGKSFFFNGHVNRFGRNEGLTCILILDIYLDLLRLHLAHHVDTI